MELKTVEMAMVREDECNPRRDFGDLDALGASFALNPMRPGEPMQPPLLVADGDAGYRVVDGARRVRAMRKIGTERFDAVVCDGLDEANTALAMLTTDDKKELDEQERSRGVQQALLLGVAPESVDAAARVTGSRRVRRAMDSVGAEKAAQMTLDHLMAVAEFEGDPERARAIAEAGDGDWEGVAREQRRLAEQAENRAAMVAALEAAGVEWREDAGFNPSEEGLVYGDRTSSPEDVPAVLEAMGGAAGVVAEIRGNHVNPHVMCDLYRPRGEEPAPDPADEEAAKEAARLAELADEVMDAVYALALEMARATASCNLLDAAVASYLGNEAEYASLARSLKDSLDKRGIDARELKDGRAGGRVGMYIFTRYAEGRAPARYAIERAIKGEAGEWETDRLRGFVALASLAADDGAEFTEEQADAIAEINDLCAAGGDAE